MRLALFFFTQLNTGSALCRNQYERVAWHHAVCLR